MAALENMVCEENIEKRCKWKIQTLNERENSREKYEMERPSSEYSQKCAFLKKNVDECSVEHTSR